MLYQEAAKVNDRMFKDMSLIDFLFRCGDILFNKMLWIGDGEEVDIGGGGGGGDGEEIDIEIIETGADMPDNDISGPL